MTNSADPDQLASSEANWSGSTLFAKTGHVVFSKRRVKKFPWKWNFESKWGVLGTVRSTDHTQTLWNRPCIVFLFIALTITWKMSDRTDLCQALESFTRIEVI